MRLKSKAQLPRLSAYEYELYRAMDHILTLTNKDRFTLLHDAPQLPVSVAAPGIDVDELNEIKCLRHEEPTLVMCGYFADKTNRDAALGLFDMSGLILQEHYLSYAVNLWAKALDMRLNKPNRNMKP